MKPTYTIILRKVVDGFEVCAHPSDFIPYDPNPHTDPVNYRDIHFVLDECLKLARRIQLVYGK